LAVNRTIAILRGLAPKRLNSKRNQLSSGQSKSTRKQSIITYNALVFRITAGKYRFQDPGQALFSFTYNDFSLPQSTGYQIAQAVGVNPDGYTIDCNVKTIITFTIGGLDIPVSFVV
jgi:hypothetical protein